MSWREAVRLSGPSYTELAFQAIYGLRLGNLPLALPPEGLGARARRRVLQSKLLVSLLVGLMTFVGALALLPVGYDLVGSGLPPPLYDAAVLAAVLVLQMALLWWTGLNILPTYLASAVLPTLETLPVDSRVLDRTALVLFLRLFDLPALTGLLLTPLSVGAALGSPVAGLFVLPGEAAVIVFALALSLLTGRFFVRRVQGASGGAGRAALRWVYLVLWTVPAFAMYGFVSFAPRFLGTLAGLLASGPGAAVDAVVLTFPLPLTLLGGFVSAPATMSGLLGGAGTLGVLAAAAAYLALVVRAGLWLRGAPRRFATQTAEADAAATSAPVSLLPRSIPLAVLLKDLRTASRTPGYAFLILLPLLDAGAVGLFTVLASPNAADAGRLATGAVVLAALLATFFGPAFFAIEVLGYSYTRSLPLPHRGLLIGKVLLVATLYLLAAAIVLGLTLVRAFDPVLFLAFVAAELPAVLAAALLELGLLTWVAGRRGLPIVNLYSGAWTATLVTVPGLAVAGLPLLAYEFGGPLVPGVGPLGLLAGIALLELAATAPWTLGRRERGIA